MKLEWDKTGERLFETGIEKGVLYKQENGAYPSGEAWNGLISVTENPTGGEPNALYANNIKYQSLMSTEELGLTIEAYMYPDSFAECDGSKEIADGVTIGQQSRSPFGLSYVTRIGNDTEGTDHGYKIHLVYGCLASPSSEEHSTINESPEAETMSWEVDTTPVKVPGFKPTASIEINSTKVDATKLASLESILYGSEEAEAKLPLPSEVATIFSKG